VNTSEKEKRHKIKRRHTEEGKAYQICRQGSRKGGEELAREPDERTRICEKRNCGRNNIWNKGGPIKLGGAGGGNQVWRRLTLGRKRE